MCYPFDYMVGNLSLRAWHRLGQQPPPLFPNLLSLLFCSAALFTANVSFDLPSIITVEVAFLPHKYLKTCQRAEVFIICFSSLLSLLRTSLFQSLHKKMTRNMTIYFLVLSLDQKCHKIVRIHLFLLKSVMHFAFPRKRQ